MNIDHLALLVTDQQRSRDFYETHFGFDQGPAMRYEDGTLIIHNKHGFALALHAGGPIGPQDDFSHFGFSVPDAEAVRDMQQRIERAGRPIVEENNEPTYVSFKFLDPDGYRVEVAWEEVS
jgi:catechol 2,3-dioxygenase-like lactoylglutathione lyase family enzyme